MLEANSNVLAFCTPSLEQWECRPGQILKTKRMKNGSNMRVGVMVVDM
jgi:hypothetical protein